MSNQKSKKIFLILGIAREKRNWSKPIKVLQVTFPDFEVIALDNPGMGEYHKTAVPLSIEKNVDFLKTSFDKLKGDENYFIGWSLGGMIVSKWSQLYPKDMNGIVLITSSYGSLSMVWQRLRTLIIPLVVFAIISKGKRRENGMFNTTCKNEQNRERLVNEWIKIDEESPVTVINIIRQLIAATLFYTKSFKKLHPTLVLGAPNDQLVNNKCSKAIATFLDAPYKEHPTAGHDVFNDEPEWVAKEVLFFINEYK